MDTQTIHTEVENWEYKRGSQLEDDHARVFLHPDIASSCSGLFSERYIGKCERHM